MALVLNGFKQLLLVMRDWARERDIVGPNKKGGPLRGRLL